MATPLPALRPAEPADQPFIEALFIEDRTAVLAGWGLPADLAATMARQQLAAREADWGVRFADAWDQIIEVAGAPVGRLLLCAEGEALRVVDIALQAAARGRGVGAQVLAGLQAQGRPLVLSVAFDNPARRLYARLGFAGPDDGLYASLVWTPHHTTPTTS